MKRIKRMKKVPEDEIKIDELSSKYTVKRLGTNNVADILDLCRDSSVMGKRQLTGRTFLE